MASRGRLSCGMFTYQRAVLCLPGLSSYITGKQFRSFVQGLTISYQEDFGRGNKQIGIYSQMETDSRY